MLQAIPEDVMPTKANASSGMKFIYFHRGWNGFHDLDHCDTQKLSSHESTCQLNITGLRDRVAADMGKSITWINDNAFWDAVYSFGPLQYCPSLQSRLKMKSHKISFTLVFEENSHTHIQ